MNATYGAAQITIAATVARDAHAGQKYGDGDYFTDHVAKVAFNVKAARGTWEQIAAAYLHDVLEDTEVTDVDLVNFGVDPVVVAFVGVLTRKDDEVYADYIDRIPADLVLVKLADLNANLDADPPERLRKRYLKALDRLFKKLLEEKNGYRN